MAALFLNDAPLVHRSNLIIVALDFFQTSTSVSSATVVSIVVLEPRGAKVPTESLNRKHVQYNTGISCLFVLA